MKKILMLGVIGLLVSVYDISAYTHKVINRTKYPVIANIEYVVCKNDEKTLQPGETWDNNGKLCIVSKVTAKVLYSGLTEDVITALKSTKIKSIDIDQCTALVKPKLIDANSYQGPYTGSGVWAITGTSEKDFRIDRI